MTTSFRLRVDDKSVTAKQVVLDTGTRTLIPPIEGLDKADFICAENWLDHIELPAHVSFIGGGYIGLEMSQFYRRMGSRVTVIEESDQIAGHEDKEIARALQEMLESEGIEFHLNARASGIASDDDGVKLKLESKGGAHEVQASHLFVAAGRRPNTNNLGLETIGLETDEKGFIETNRKLATGVKGVWAAGDIRGGPMFTHTSWDDYRVLHSQLTGDGSRTTDRIVPYAIFTDPELGRAGMTESEARSSGRKIKTGRFDMKKNGKAREFSATKGFIKVVIDVETDRILGAAVLAAEGAELIHIYIALMNADAPYSVIENAVHIHPTLAEAVQSAVSSIE